eukprot:c28948_g1_i2 orf=875-3034(+)
MPPLACLTGHSPVFYNAFSATRMRHGDGGAKEWAIGKSASLYRVDTWGAPYFLINEKGNMAVRPRGNATKPKEEIDIMMVVQKLASSMPLPLIIRFPDVLKHRLETLQVAFDHGILVHGYQRRFQGVFPIKCNQDRYVVENIVEFGKPYGFGLEAGSKPELVMAMSCLCKGSREALLICNGYKDCEYVALALIARQLGLNSVIVLEEAEELEIVLKMSQQLQIDPVIGLRAKLNTKHGGHFGETSGEKGKFGLSSVEIVGIVQKLRRVGMLDRLQLLHFHLGSQIPSIAVLNDGVSEAAHIYCELALMGAGMNYIDVGGGLGIDYDGSRSASSDMSVGYTIEEFAEQVVAAVQKACLLKKAKQPILCSESGRALVSHHSVLVFDVFSSQQRNGNTADEVGLPLDLDGLPEHSSSLYRRLTGYARTGDYECSLECAQELKHESIDLFKQGRLTLIQLAKINAMYEMLSALVDKRRNEMLLLPTNALLDRDDDIDLNLTVLYRINLSIFKSMPDTWAIDQLFPIVPLHRLDQQPTVRAILSDLTCDSDGKICTFVASSPNGQKHLHYLPLHALEPHQPYYLGMFLGGAYQEALGGMHNLFGTPNVIHVAHSGGHNTCLKITQAIAGHSTADVLRLMHHDPHAMFQELINRVEECLEQGRLGENQETALEVIKSLAQAFDSCPYLLARCAQTVAGGLISLHSPPPSPIEQQQQQPPPCYCPT